MYNLQIPLWLSQPLMDGRAIDFSQNWQKRNLNFTYEFKKHHIITVNKGKMYNLQIPLWLSQPLMDGRAIDFSQNWQKRNLNFTYEFKKESHYNR